ncbi:MAG TPA: hypothetical protein VFU89_05955 [Rhabdochlamydiaceae bacterium]|nr:hypothetical protein [Rhabdochlamydiaceae bacterium]
MVSPCKSGFSGQWQRAGLLALRAFALIAWIYRRTIVGFLYPSNTVLQQNDPPQSTLAKQPAARKFEAIQIPSNVTMTYQGSNAEYIVFKKDGSQLSEQEYLDLAVPILKLQFPRNKAVEETLTPEVLDQLDQNEVAYIDQVLDAKGLKAIKIPKTLYDIFYIAFRFSISALSSKEADACQATTSLERFLHPSASIYHYQPNLLVLEKDVHQAFVTIDGVASKADAELNTYIFQDLMQKKYTQDTLSWEAIISIVDDLFHRIEGLNQSNEGSFGFLYTKKCLSKNCKESPATRLHHWNHYVFRMVRNFVSSQPKILAVFKKALWLEFSQSSSVYTCYRGGQQEMERELSAPVLHSGSYGHSLCSSCERDMGGAGAIPVEYIREYGYGYVVSLNKADYRQGSASHFFVIPPAQRTARFRLDGEFTHVRTRVHKPRSPEETVVGMRDLASGKVPYIATKGHYATPELFHKELRQYLDHQTKTLT